MSQRRWYDIIAGCVVGIAVSLFIEAAGDLIALGWAFYGAFLLALALHLVTNDA